MGLTRQYLRYAPKSVLGTGYSKSNIAFVTLHGIHGRYVAVSSCEQVIIWDIRKGEKLVVLQGDHHEVNILRPCPDKRHIAVGYTNGTVRVFSLLTGECIVTFTGHKSAVTCLAYDAQGVRLASGSLDTEMVVWDIVDEAGLCRLHGHKGSITQVSFISSENVLISASKDALIKFWDLVTQHCFYTIVSHRSEVWDFCLWKDDHRIITGSSDSEIRVWDILYHREIGNLEEDAPQEKQALKDCESDDIENELTILKCNNIGSMLRQGRERVMTISCNSNDRIFAVVGQKSNMVELFLLCNTQEIKKRSKKRLLKAKRHAEEEEKEIAQDNKLSLQDEMKRLEPIKVSGRISALDFVTEKSGEIKLLVLLSTKILELYSLSVEHTTKTLISEKIYQFTLPGHDTDVRTLCFSSDNTSILSASANTLNVWSRATDQVIRTMECDYALCSLFVPGDRHCIVGTKAGDLLIYDTGANVLLERLHAHNGAVWSACIQPDHLGFVTGGADKEAKFWMFELVSESKKSAKQLSLTHTRTLQLSDDILCVKISPDQRYIAVALLDLNVKIFFMDSFRFHMSLYGHKLPVLCMDIAYDNSLIVTGSSDKNIKIWGMDFGDCHKSIFAHDDSIMAIQFIPKTHLFFSAGKDMMIKQWDADNFEKILTLQGHHGAVWALTISSNGKYLATAANDKSIRLWERTQEPLILDEEQEMEREQEFEKSAATNSEFVIPGEAHSEVKMVGKKTMESVKGAEKIMEALNTYRQEVDKKIEHDIMCKVKGEENVTALALNPLFMAYNVETPERFVLAIIHQIKSSELEEALLVLPFSYVTDLCKVLHKFVKNGWEVELTTRCLLFLLRIHHGQIVGGDELLSVIDDLNTSVEEQVNGIRDVMGFNLAGLNVLLQEIEGQEEATVFEDLVTKVKKKKQKKAEVLKQNTVALLSM